jgi:hypothetical protein
VPLKPALREPDGGLRFLEEKLSIYVQGANGSPGHRRNPALDLLTGRVPDHRLQPGPSAGAPAWLQPARGVADGASAPARLDQPVDAPARFPETLVIPLPAATIAPRPVNGAGAGSAPIAPAAAAERPSPSPWLLPSKSASAAVPRIHFDAAVRGGSATWRMARWLLAPLAAGLLLAAGVGLVRGLVQPYETIIVSRFPILGRPEPTARTEASGSLANPTAARVDSVGTAVAAAGELETAPTRPQPTLAPPSPVPSDQLTVLLDERFGSSSDNARGWTNNPSGVAWLADGAYHLFARQSAKFVAVSVPGTQDLSDVVVSARFRKTAGPAGGGYGLIVRDQVSATDRSNGESQAGPFYVFEVGDKGELGVWLREGDHWVDLLPWTPSDAIHPGLEANDLTVSAMGDRLSFLVNGVPVATQLDTLLHTGGVAIFTGGDGNQVAVDRLTVRTPR